MSETLSAEEKAQFEAMAAADAEPIEPAPSPEPAPEPADPAPEPAEPTQPPPAKTVPIEALHAERKRAQTLAQQMGEVERKNAADMARLQERLDLLAQAAQAATMVQQPAAPVAAPDPQPDAQTNPAEYLQWLGRTVTTRLSELDQRLRGTEQFAQQGQRQTQQQQHTQALINWGQQEEASFAATQPDYGQATAFLRESRMRELQAAGIMAPGEAQSAIAQDLIGLAQQARQRGVNFGRMLYNLAQARGYTPAEAAAAAPAPAPATPAVDPAAALDRATRGATMGAGLPAGGAPRGEPTVQALANMSEAQFAAHLAKVAKDPASMRALFGE